MCCFGLILGQSYWGDILLLRTNQLQVMLMSDLVSLLGVKGGSAIYPGSNMLLILVQVLFFLLSKLLMITSFL